MNTQSHALVDAPLFGRQVPRTALGGRLAGWCPMLPILAIIAGLKLSGVQDEVIFGQMYWQPWWLVTTAIGQSFLLWGELTLLCLKMVRNNAAPVWRLGLALAAALLHFSIDFLLLHGDAHMHLWPLGAWKFDLPVSYWDPAQYGGVFGLFELVFGITMAVLLFRRYHSLIVSGLLGVAILAYLAVPAYFMVH